MLVILPWIAVMVLFASSLRFGGSRILPERMLPGTDLRTGIRLEQDQLRAELADAHAEVDRFAGLGTRDRRRP